ncbi:hypothetical protein [endosymbiont 'TC1' of Trimyema compressum]|uniref:hypothetical protein n=1 Tax=endosymbiont 'TC1' of Trimyema compressum TaxID=243899 RepID=UPI000B2BA6C1
MLVSIFDTIMHISANRLPFSGVGASGMGSYHGKKSFEAFSHYKSVLFKSIKIDLNLKYPPAANKLKAVKKLLRKNRLLAYYFKEDAEKGYS